MRLKTQATNSINYYSSHKTKWTFSFSFSDVRWRCEWRPPAKWRTRPSSPARPPRSTWTPPCRGPGSWSRRTWCPCTRRPGAAACPRPATWLRWQSSGRRPTRAILCAAEEIRVLAACHFNFKARMSFQLDHLAVWIYVWTCVSYFDTVDGSKMSSKFTLHNVLHNKMNEYKY